MVVCTAETAQSYIDVHGHPEPFGAIVNHSILQTIGRTPLVRLDNDDVQLKAK